MIRRILAKVWVLVKLDNRGKRWRFALKACLQDPTLYPLKPSPGFDPEVCATTFLENQAILNVTVRRRGGVLLTYLQPYNGSGARALSLYDVANLAHMTRRVLPDGSTQMDALNEFYRRVLKEQPGVLDHALHDLRSIFDACPGSGSIYIDQVHCSDRGYDLIGRRMAADILEHEAKKA